MSSKQEMVSRIARDSGLTTKKVDEVLSLLAGAVASNLAECGEALIPGVAKVKKVERKARTGRNPRTGEPVAIAAKSDVKFTALKALKDSL